MRRALRIAVASATAILGLASCAETPPPVVHTSALGHQPNIVMVLTDDLSWDLIPYMPHVAALQRAGMTFTNYTTTDSLCCPSRSSIFTGEFPHDTQVFTNTGVDGGFRVFHRTGDEDHTFAVTLHSVGYRTAMMGKYLNGYFPRTQYAADGEPELGTDTWVPPGWDTWDVAGWGYPEYNYDLNENHVVHHYGRHARDYLTNVMSAKGREFMAQSAHQHKPFFLELATFSPHKPATPAPRDADAFADAQAPRTLAWNRVPEHAPPWLAHHPGLSPADVAAIDQEFRQRVRSVQSVDRMIGALEATLKRTGQADNTVFMFTSDNGYHMGQYTLRPGKLTAFDSDVEVPLIVVGPHIPADTVNTSIVQNIDLAPTFDTIAGAQVPSMVDGHSFVSLLAGRQVPWRSTALIEHHGLDFDPTDPDQQNRDQGNPPTYEALRTATYTYVQYRNGQHEYYDRVTDPAEIDNVYASLSASKKAQLEDRIASLESCHDGSQCWDAGRPATT